MLFVSGGWAFIEGLETIDSLSLQGATNDFPIGQQLNLLSLSALYLTHSLAVLNLNVPNLLRLTVPTIFVRSDFSNVSFPNLRTLKILGTERARNVFTLDPADYPELRELIIGTKGQLNLWNPTSLSHLVSISFEPGGLFNPRGNHLCMWLIYYPDQCPSLQNIRFGDFVDWDVLFVMLERRNLECTKAARIQKVTLPFTPYILRGPLDKLLNGRREGRLLESLPLTLEDTREIIFESNVPGCITCLKNMRPGCTAEVTRWPVVANTASFPEYEDPSDVVPHRIKDWLENHRHLQRKWEASWAEFQKNHYRPWICSQYLPLETSL